MTRCVRWSNCSDVCDHVSPSNIEWHCPLSTSWNVKVTSCLLVCIILEVRFWTNEYYFGDVIIWYLNFDLFMDNWHHYTKQYYSDMQRDDLRYMMEPKRVCLVVEAWKKEGWEWVESKGCILAQFGLIVESQCYYMKSIPSVILWYCFLLVKEIPQLTHP